MNYEYPLNRNRLRIEQEELLLKLALFHYLERENDRLRARMQEQPDPPEDRESAEHAVDRAMRRQRWQVFGQKAWQVSGRVVTRVAVVFLTFFHLFKHRFCGIPVGQERRLQDDNFPAGPLYQCNGGPTPAGHVHRCGPLHLGALLCPNIFAGGV